MSKYFGVLGFVQVEHWCLGIVQIWVQVQVDLLALGIVQVIQVKACQILQS